MSFSISTAISDSAQYALANIHTCMPGQIVSYDYTTQLASIQPCVDSRYSNGDVQRMPILNSCPVIFPKCGGASLTFPVNVGDPCLVICCERSIDNWFMEGGILDPQDTRRFDLSDSVAIMGLSPQNYPNSQGVPTATVFSATNNTDVLLTYAGGTVRIKPDGSTLVTGTKVAVGNSTTELLNVISQVLGYLSTSVTQPVTNPVQYAAQYATLKTAIDTLKATI